MRSSYLILVAGVLFSGCSSTIRFSSIEEANRQFEGNSATILLLKSSKEYRAQNIKVGQDSTIFLDHNADSIKQFCNTDIYGFRNYDHIIGAFDGFKAGGLVGIPFGLIVIAIGDRYAVGIGFLIMVPSMILGTIVGLLEGHENIYTLPTHSTNQLYSKEKKIAP